MKNYRILLLFLLITFYTDCKLLDISLSDLRYQNSLYYYKGEPFTGQAYSFFEDSKSKAFCASFNNGIPLGTWQSFGYQGEVIQYGTYKPKILDGFEIEFNKEMIKVDRITLVEFYEGEYSILYVLLINNKFENEVAIDDINIQARAISQMPKNIKLQKYSKIIYRFAYREIE